MEGILEQMEVVDEEQLAKASPQTEERNYLDIEQGTKGEEEKREGTEEEEKEEEGWFAKSVASFTNRDK